MREQFPIVGRAGGGEDLRGKDEQQREKKKREKAEKELSHRDHLAQRMCASRLLFK